MRSCAKWLHLKPAHHHQHQEPTYFDILAAESGDYLVEVRDENVKVIFEDTITTGELTTLAVP